MEELSTDHKMELKDRDVSIVRLKETVRRLESQLDECLAKIKVLEDELETEHESKTKCERMIDLYKTEIRELQIKLDECVTETKRLVNICNLIIIILVLNSKFEINHNIILLRYILIED